MNQLDHVLLACFLLFFLASTDHAHADERPNFVLIVCDNLGYGDIEPFGSTLHRTPNLNRMAEEGRCFRHFYSVAGVCTPSRAALMTGRYPLRVGLARTPRDGAVLRPLSPYGLDPAVTTIADLLKPAGYVCALIGKWHLGDRPKYLPTRQGFDLYYGIPYSDDMTQETGRRLGRRYDGFRWPPLPLMWNEHVIEAPVDRTFLTQKLTAAAVRFLRQHCDQPFLLVLAHAMPGSTSRPFASPPFQGKSRNGPWGDAVEEIDWSTGVLLAELDRLGISKRTLVIFTSDNGAPMTGKPGDLSRGSNGPLEGRGYTTAEGGFRVPMIARWPGRIPPATTSDELCTMMDFLPTLAALTNQPLPEEPIDGHDIRPLLFGNGRSPYRYLLYYYEDQLQAIRAGRYKLYLPLSSPKRHPHFRPGKPTRPLLFDVVNDPGCRQDLSSRLPDVVQRLSELAESARL